ncbi:MAG TPA: gamma-glutamyltransferase [bacterium]|nr:gamma-glutamyltransferase [bacterium]
MTPTPQGHQGRAVVIARNGIVAAGHPLAAAAGLHVLQGGGNAVDAAVAVAGVLGVVQPMMSGLGGDAFILIWSAAERKVHAVNGSGIAPFAATREWFTSRGYSKMPLRGMLSVSVPGAVDAMQTILGKWGSGRYTLSRLFEPAIEYADRGFPVAPKVAYWIGQAAEVLGKFPSSARVFLPQGRPPHPGEILINRDYAASLRAVAAGGADAFYRGQVSRRISDYVRGHGGLLTEREFAEHRSEVHEPIRTTYRGLTVCTTAPPSQGVIVLEILNILEGFAPEQLQWGTAEAVHLAVETKKLAVADRLAYLGDPKFVDNPLEVLLAKDYATRRRGAVDRQRAQSEAPAGALPEAVGDTTYFCVADREGNVVSYITSLSASFGCGEVVDGTGIMLNNRAGRGFVLQDDHPNCVAPGKRTMHTLMPFMALKEGTPHLAWGTPGGDGQPQWNTQVFLNIVDGRMNIQQAIDAPRWFSFPSTDPASLPGPFELRMESGFPEQTRSRLTERGHVLREMGEMESGGGCQTILISDGVYQGGSDPRVDGCAIGY